MNQAPAQWNGIDGGTHDRCFVVAFHFVQEEALISCAETRGGGETDASIETEADRARAIEEAKAAAQEEAAADAELARRIASHQAAGPSW